jgi:hypothetical protein
MFSMGNPQRKKPEDITGRLYFDRYIQDEDNKCKLSEKEIAEMRAEMDAINAQHQQNAGIRTNAEERP